MLSPAALLAAARDAAGLSDFGDDHFRDGLTRLVTALNGEARLHAIGEAAMAQQITGFLGQRLQVVDWHKRHPEIAEEPIVAPLIGLGLPRSGSTALACLLGEDAATRSLINWQAMAPCPPPGAAPETVGPRIAAAEAAMAQRAERFPRMTALLPSTATSPTECQTLMAQDCQSQLFQAFAYIPSYAEWLETEADLTPTYAHVKKVLQLLQWRSERKPWRLKNPAHSLFITALTQIFPDARFVMTHRAISAVLPSVADVYFELSRAFSDHADITALAAMNMASWQRGMERMIAFRAAGHEHRFCDIGFAAFQADPMAEIARLYAFLGEPLTDATRAAMQAWRQTRPNVSQSITRATLADCGLDRAALDARFAFYTDAFGEYL